MRAKFSKNKVHLSEEHKKKISLANRGKNNGMFGRHLTNEEKSHLSKLNKGQNNGMFGKTMPIDARIKISKFNIGKKASIETKEKMSNSRRGKTKDIIWRSKIAESNKGKHIFTEEQLKTFSGKNSYLWKGGISFLPYTTDWTSTLRRSIRERDHYTCQFCFVQQDNRAFSVHHIDYNKNNCNPNNLITLCTKCHSKTNIDREMWKKYFITNRGD